MTITDATLKKRYVELLRLRIRVAEAEIEHARQQLGRERPTEPTAAAREEVT